jgi:hypothetical protein
MASGTISQALETIYSSLEAEGNGIKGTDASGEEFDSIVDMWQCLGV